METSAKSGHNVELVRYYSCYMLNKSWFCFSSKAFMSLAREIKSKMDKKSVSYFTVHILLCLYVYV